MLPKIYFFPCLSFPIVIWNPHYSSLLHSQKVIDFLTAKPNNPSTVPFSVPKQGPILLAVLLSRISPLGFWDTALCWSTFLSSSCPGTLPLWSSLSIILCSYISLSLSKLLLFIHTTGKLCFWASPRHSPTYNALILATSPRTEAVFTSEVLLWWLTCFPSCTQTISCQPCSCSVDHILHCHNYYFFIVVKLFVEINHISPTKYNLEIWDFSFQCIQEY